MPPRNQQVKVDHPHPTTLQLKQLRNRLLVKTISNLLVLSLVSPPRAQFEPAKYVKEWRNAIETLMT